MRRIRARRAFAANPPAAKFRLRQPAARVFPSAMPESAARPGLEWKRLVRRFRVPLRTATGEYAVRESIVVRLTDSAGRAGYGEVAPWPGFPVETLDAAEAQLVEIRNTERGARNHGCADGGLAGNANLQSGYASPPCFRHEADDPDPVVPSSGFPVPSLSATPCVATALSHARDWIANDRGMAESAAPCAGLLHDADDIVATEDKCAEGFSTLKLKVGRAALREEQRAVAVLIRNLSDIAPVRLRLDANGALTPAAYEAWCDFLSEFSEIEWLEQPLRPGAETRMRSIAEAAGVSARIALDESACRADTLPADWPGVLAVKPLLLGDLDDWRERRKAYPRIAYASVFESPFGRQSALCVAAEAAGFVAPAVAASGLVLPRVGSGGRVVAPAVGFDTLGVFDDDLEVHAPGPVARTVAREPEFWEALWKRIP